MENRKWKLLLPVGIVLMALIVVGTMLIAGGLVGTKEKETPPPPVTVTEVPQVETPKEKYDVIVVGTDPEGVTAAVSAARNGLKTLLVDGKDREIMGGLFTLGWLNSLDMNRTPDGKDYYNKGLFKEWFDQIEGDSFDIVTAANAFHRMVEAEENIEVRMGLEAIEPIVEESENGDSVVTGAKLTMGDGTSLQVSASAVIDATQDADFAAAAGAEFTFGREDIGDTELLMAVTPVFKLTNVTPEVWSKVKERLNGDESDGTGANDHSAWGYVEMWDYPSTNPERIRSRGLNLGRQNDETMLVNSVQIFGVDPFDPASREEAYEIARKELPLMLEHMKKLYPEFADIELGELAPELYIRETRHLVGMYRLNMVDLLEQRTHPDDIAYGSYPVDIQSTSAAKTDRGAVLMGPKLYGVPFGALVPQTIDGLLVVGRSASFDTLPHGSARVVPLGMATGEAAGAAVKVSLDENVSLRELAASEQLVDKLQERLTAQGMDLEAPKTEPYAFISHPAYEGLKAAVSMGIAQGAYKNDFALDETSNPKRIVNNMAGVSKVYRDAFPHAAAAAIEGMADSDKQPLTLEQAAYTIAISIYGEAQLEGSLARLTEEGVITNETLSTIKDQQELTNGDVYLLLKDAVAKVAGVTY
ncbi:FAD-dependent oxidoreductase [Paenibacillus nanensis]|uniref:FAD-dependent oxidoreductase n=1 Tax=Paenibacillus nanensis TaxID=393251 RepID=A0A3A1V038_9BACL|nr:FAD-dependent oxidoreductase [Paenibacillus nanensis]RIX52812.1 FAD-dependent oxidoreductase [Paenibacillus nanensis]